MIPPDPPPAADVESDATSRVAVDCYLSAILDIAETVAAIYPEIGATCHEQLTRMRARLAFEANRKTLQESRDTLHQILDAFAVQASHYNQTLNDELSRTLALVAQNEDARSGRGVRYVERLVDCVEQMEKAVYAGDLNQLASQVSQLRRFAESIEIDTRDAFYRLRDQMREYQHRLREAELLASRDVLTGIANRREFERQLAARLQAQREFCVLLFDMDNLKSINDRLGHLCGDEVLKQLAARLSGQVRTRDFVCRWGGDEFAVILDCGLDPGLARSRQIAECLNRPYPAAIAGQERMVEVHVSVGIAQYAAGETPEQLFRRVDESMYRQKDARSLG
ncbi:MAG TPA: GGDEF domain-containing protein [Bryobacteraceae bacterium]|nr:GGDEF domain-containing protein [Bryobacteraceae bacterium]